MVHRSATFSFAKSLVRGKKTIVTKIILVLDECKITSNFFFYCLASGHINSQLARLNFLNGLRMRHYESLRTFCSQKPICLFSVLCRKCSHGSHDFHFHFLYTLCILCRSIELDCFQAHVQCLSALHFLI